MGLDPVVYGGGILKSPIIYNKSGLSNIQFVDAPTPTAGGSITAYCDPTYDGIDFAGNVYFDGTNWIKYDAWKPAHSLYHDAANDRTSLWRSAVSESQGAPITNWVMHTILEADVANGLAKLDANGSLLVPNGKVVIPIDDTNNIEFWERTNNENYLLVSRSAANDFDIYIRESGSIKQIQTEGHKDVASGIVGLDANGLINLIGQASLEATPVGDFESGTDIYHAHDAEVNGGYGPYAYKVLKTITLEHSPSPTAVYRVYFELDAGGATPNSTARVYVNGAAVGAELQSTAPNTYVTQTENITGLGVGDTIELWVLNQSSKLAKVRNFRILCDTKGMVNS